MNKKLEQLLLYVGSAGALVSALAYLVVIGVLVVGVGTAMELNQLLLVSIIGAFAGLLVVGMLRSQGKMFAEKEEVSMQVMKEYYTAINKNKPPKELHTIRHYMIWSTVKDVFSKGATLAATTYFSITVFMEGNGDFSLFGLAVANIFMFISFGILAMRSSYMFYMNEHIPAIRQLIENLKKEAPHAN